MQRPASQTALNGSEQQSTALNIAWWGSIRRSGWKRACCGSHLTGGCRLGAGWRSGHRTRNAHPCRTERMTSPAVMRASAWRDLPVETEVVRVRCSPTSMVLSPPGLAMLVTGSGCTDDDCWVRSWCGRTRTSAGSSCGEAGSGRRYPDCGGYRDGRRSIVRARGVAAAHASVPPRVCMLSWKEARRSAWRRRRGQVRRPELVRCPGTQRRIPPTPTSVWGVNELGHAGAGSRCHRRRRPARRCCPGSMPAR